MGRPPIGSEVMWRPSPSSSGMLAPPVDELREVGPDELLDRITTAPTAMGGRACIRGLGVTVGMVGGQIGAGQTVYEMLADYPYLDREVILQALGNAAWPAEDRGVVLVGAWRPPKAGSTALASSGST